MVILELNTTKEAVLTRLRSEPIQKSTPPEQIFNLFLKKRALWRRTRGHILADEDQAQRLSGSPTVFSGAGYPCWGTVPH